MIFSCRTHLGRRIFMSSVTSVGDIVWQPSNSRVETSKMHEYLQYLSQNFNVKPTWDAAFAWSVAQKEDFWKSVAAFTDVKWDHKSSKTTGLESGSMLGVDWFSGATLNYAENVLEDRPMSDVAITSYLEGADKVTWTWSELKSEVCKVRQALLNQGVVKGDRVCGVLVNGPHAVSCMLAAASIGAIWSSSSPDFGYSGICDRFSQVTPKVLFFSKSYAYNGKTFDCSETAKQVADSIPSLEKTILIDHLSTQETEYGRDDLIAYDVFLSASSVGNTKIEYEPLAFNDPLYIMFSSGTTGVPKCIVHGVGGTLLQHKKELALHTDLQAGDKLFYFTTCGWMMWNWMVSALTLGAGIVTFDGSVTSPTIGVLWEIVEAEKVKAFGTSPKFLSACMKQGYIPSETGNFGYLKTILSTGAPLLPEHYEWIYGAFHNDLQLASISGGTDIISCFMLGNPLLPVRLGEIQSRGLGMDVESWTGYQESVTGEKGELICKSPFVSMPIGFWNDLGHEKFKSAYFDYYLEDEKNSCQYSVWRHGDFIEVSPSGGIIVYGRSDATLNPGGVRIGTAEIYRTVESHANVIDSLVVGVPTNGDVDVVLFVKLRDADISIDQLSLELKKIIRKELTPRHVPARVFQVKDIPYTRSGKKVELAVRGALQGIKAANESALANPEVMTEYYDLASEFSS
jgi:acetoacetyl-CoA synthetase